MTEDNHKIWPNELVHLDDLIPWEHNPRRITKTAYKKLVEDIRNEGYHDRVLCNANNVVASGHQRLKALKELGYTTIPVVKSPKLLSEDEFKRIVLKSNGHAGEWDYDAMANIYDVDILIEYGIIDEEYSASESEKESIEKEESFKCGFCGK
jgi:ParB-like chromosome segregation protein Spo0J